MGIYHSLISFSLSSIAISLLTLSQFFFKPSFGLVALTSINDLEWTSDQRLAKNYIVYLQSACHLDFGFSYVPEIPVDYEFFQYFELPLPLDDHFDDDGGDDNYNSNMNSCIVLGLLQGTPKDLISYPLFENVFTPHLQQEHQQLSYLDWITNFHRKEIGWMSEYPEPLDIYFYDEEVGNVLVAALNPFEAQTVWLDTYLGHIFRVIHPVTEELIDEIIVQYDSYHTYFVDFQRIELKNLDHREDLLNGVNDTLHHEYARSLRVQRTFTPLGFAKGTLPRDLYASMMTYYLNNYNSVYIEDWKDMFHVNWWEVHALMVGMPWKLKRYWQTRLRSLVERWIGGKVPLENSDIYGLRRYERHASLLSHVDREETHAVSLIINLEQRNMDRDWMIEIYDHAGRLHEIPMQPGDIVYYESAKCLHGRMNPLHGSSYSNLFSHYRPVGDPAWFLKPNPPDTPPPLLDLDLAFQASSGGSVCSSSTGSDVCDEGEEGSYEERKQRWIEETLPFWSLENDAIQDGEGLFRYWNKVHHLPAE